MDYLALEELFKEKGWEWRIGGKLMPPIAADFKATVDTAMKTLYDEPEGSTIFVGRLAIQKADQNHFDVYVLFGEIENE